MLFESFYFCMRKRQETFFCVAVNCITNTLMVCIIVQIALDFNTSVSEFMFCFTAAGSTLCCFCIFSKYLEAQN